MAILLTVGVIGIGLFLWVSYLRSEDVQWKYIILLLVIITGGGYF